jgi:hypothetical protein
VLGTADGTHCGPGRSRNRQTRGRISLPNAESGSACRGRFDGAYLVHARRDFAASPRRSSFERGQSVMCRNAWRRAVVRSPPSRLPQIDARRELDQGRAGHALGRCGAVPPRAASTDGWRTASGGSDSSCGCDAEIRGCGVVGVRVECGSRRCWQLVVQPAKVFEHPVVLGTKSSVRGFIAFGAAQSRPAHDRARPADSSARRQPR